MGKNSVMLKAIREHLENNSALEKPHTGGNVGFAFTREDLTEISDMLLASKSPAAARAGAAALCEVCAIQNTGLGPEETSSFQASPLQSPGAPSKS